MNSKLPEPADAVLKRRDAAMMLLIAQSQGLIQQLALLANSEKAAVAGLVAVGQVLAVYAHAIQPDAEVVASFDNVLAAFAPAMARRLAAIRSAAPEPTETAAETAGLTCSLKVLLAALAPSVNGSSQADDDESKRMAGVLRSLLPRR